VLPEWQIARLHCPTVGTFQEWAVWAETSPYVEACSQVWVCPDVKAAVGLHCRPPGGVPHSGTAPLEPWDLKRGSRFKPTGLRETLHTPIEPDSAALRRTVWWCLNLCQWSVACSIPGRFRCPTQWAAAKHRVAIKLKETLFSLLQN
jgi:hypothetical protein